MPSGESDFCATGFCGGAKCNGAKPKLSDDPNLCAAKPGEGGGFANGSDGGNPGDIGGLESSMGARPGDGGGLDNALDIEAKLEEAKPGDLGGIDSVNPPSPGDGGALVTVIEAGGNPGEGGGFDRELTDDANPESGCEGMSKESRLNRPYLPGSDSSSFSVHEKLEGADDGPGEIGSLRFEVAVPRPRTGLRSECLPLETGSSTGKGAVSGSL